MYDVALKEEMNPYDDTVMSSGLSQPGPEHYMIGTPALTTMGMEFEIWPGMV